MHTLETVLKRHRKHLTETRSKEIVLKCKETLGAVVVSPAEIDLKSKIGIGSSSVVFEGKFRFMEVAIKKVALAEVSVK